VVLISSSPPLVWLSHHHHIHTYFYESKRPSWDLFLNYVQTGERRPTSTTNFSPQIKTKKCHDDTLRKRGQQRVFRYLLARPQTTQQYLRRVDVYMLLLSIFSPRLCVFCFISLVLCFLPSSSSPLACHHQHFCCCCCCVYHMGDKYDMNLSALFPLFSAA
jgi:hypothetical protein